MSLPKMSSAGSRTPFGNFLLSYTTNDPEGGTKITNSALVNTRELEKVTFV